MDDITSQTTLNLVIGDPIVHSQSPLLHRAIYKTLDIDAVLLARKPSSLAAAVDAIRTLSVALTAVTLPYKESVISYLDEVSTKAQNVGSVNTILNKEGQLYGDNTDVDGIAFAFRDVELDNARILIIGAGGAARAMGYFLKHHVSCAKMVWMNRTPEKLHDFVTQFGGEIFSNDDAPFDVICNTTPIGMYPHVEEIPLPLEMLSEHQIVFDMVYNPKETMLLREAKKRGARMISGLDMFIGQALAQVQLFSGKICPETFIDAWRSLLTLNQRKNL